MPYYPIAESSPRQTSDEAYGALVGQYEKDTNTANIRRSNEGNRLVIWLRLIPLPTIRSRDRARFGPLA